MAGTTWLGGHILAPHLLLFLRVSFGSRAAQFPFWEDLVLYHFFLLWRSWLKLLGLILVAEGLQMEKSNFLPRSKMQFGVSCCHSLQICLLIEREIQNIEL